MGREVRRVPKDWKHPVIGYFDVVSGTCKERHLPLSGPEDFQYARESFKKEMHNTRHEGGNIWQTLTEQTDKYRYHYFMPAWRSDEATYYMMYETTSEGTPISPAFATPEELARWLVDNKASVFGDMYASYEDWMRIINRGCVGIQIDGNSVSAAIP